MQPQLLGSFPSLGAIALEFKSSSAIFLISPAGHGTFINNFTAFGPIKIWPASESHPSAVVEQFHGSPAIHFRAGEFREISETEWIKLGVEQMRTGFFVHSG